MKIIKIYIIYNKNMKPVLGWALTKPESNNEEEEVQESPCD